MNPVVGIYRQVAPFPSEAFIYEQIANFGHYAPVLLMRTRLAGEPIGGYAVSDGDVHGIRQALYSVFPSGRLFRDREQLSNIDLIHAHFGQDGTYAMALAAELKIPLIVTFHGGDITVGLKQKILSGKISNLRFLLTVRQLKRRAHTIIAVSKFIENSLLLAGFPQEKVVQHYIGVDIDKFRPSVEFAERKRYVFCVGRHTQVKGIDTLIKAFGAIAAKHPDVNLVQIGGGELTDEYLKLVAALGLVNRVEFLGVRDHLTVRDFLQQAEIFALPSQTAESGQREALGIVFNEASACGVPIVATRQGGIPEAVIDGVTGLLSEERDVISLARNLDLLLSNCELRRQMGYHGREHVEKNFNIRKQSRRLERIYDRALDLNVESGR